MEKILNDEVVRELIVEVRNGNEEAFEVLSKNFERQIYHVLAKYNFSALPYESVDLVNELRLELYYAVFNFDLDRDVSFSTYVYTQYIYYVSRIFRKFNTQKRFVGIQHTFETQTESGLSYSDVVSDGNDFEKIYTQNIYVRNKLEEIKNILDELSFNIYIDYINGAKTSEIASKYKLNDDKIRNKIAYIRRKVRKYINK